MASGVISTEVDLPLARSRNPTPAKLLSAPEGHGFRHVTGPVAVDSPMSLPSNRPASALPSQAQVSGPDQTTPLPQQYLQQQEGGSSQHVGHFLSSPVMLPSQPSSNMSNLHRPPQGIMVTGNPRQQQPPAQITPSPLSSRIGRPQVQVGRQEGRLESRAHPVVTRPVANVGQPQGGPSPVTGTQLGKTKLLLQRAQGSPQDKIVPAQKVNLSQGKGVQRAHARNPGWQAPPFGQHAQATPSGQPRVFYQHQHQLLSSQPRVPPQEQALQHHSAISGVAVPQQYAQQQQLRGVVPAGNKPMQIYPVLRTPAGGTPTASHSDPVYRDRASDHHIVVHIGDRKVKLLSETDPSSLYALCRRWVRNDIPRKDRPGLRDIMNIPLPRPLSVAEVDKAEVQVMENGTKIDDDHSKIELLAQSHASAPAKGDPFCRQVETPVQMLMEEDLLKTHILHFKNVRKRSRQERMRRIARFKPRLALLLPGNIESS